MKFPTMIKLKEAGAEVREHITLVERQMFLKLPIEERRKRMARQAREMAADYKVG